MAQKNRKSKKQHSAKGFQMIMIIFCVVFLMVIQLSGFVKTKASDAEDDLKMSVLMENAIMIMENEGALIVNEQTTSQEIGKAFEGFFEKVPVPKKENTVFVVNTMTKKVFVREKAQQNEVSVVQ